MTAFHRGTDSLISESNVLMLIALTTNQAGGIVEGRLTVACKLVLGPRHLQDVEVSDTRGARSHRYLHLRYVLRTLSRKASTIRDFTTILSLV